MFASTVALVVAMAFTGCSGSSPANPVSPPAGPDSSSSGSGQATVAEVELRFDQTLEHQDLQLRWLKLEDSRCPIGVVCIWAGQIVVSLEVSRGEEGPVEIELVNRLKGEPQAIEAFGYALRLLGVEPHPKEGQTPERGDYVARIEIAGS
jgi:hypothetical protein